MTLTATPLTQIFVLFILSIILTACGGGRERDIDDGGLDDSCRRHEQCEEDELCSDSRCQPAYGTTYRIGITNVSLSRTNSPSGDAWDDDGTAPDPYICFTIGDGEDAVEECTDVDEDTYSPVFDAFLLEAVLEEAQLFMVELCDDDGESSQCWIVAEMYQVRIQELRAATISLIPDDPTRLGDWAVTLSFRAM